MESASCAVKTEAVIFLSNENITLFLHFFFTFIIDTVLQMKKKKCVCPRIGNTYVFFAAQDLNKMNRFL